MNIDKLDWKFYKDGHQYVKDKIFPIPFLYADCYSTINDGVEYTLGIYKYKGREVFKAWGVRGEPDCTGHSVTIDNGITWSEPTYTCPEVDLVIERGEIVGFAIMHDFKVYVYTASTEPKVLSIRDYAQSSYTTKQKIILYRPLIITIVTSIISGSLLTYYHILAHSYMMNIMGIFILIIGLLKFVNKKNFEEMFSSYDPLAKKIKNYAKIYPYLEVGLGALMLFNIFMYAVNILVIIIYSMTTFGIIKVLSSGQKLNCACVGGKYTIPLSRVTVFENSVMIMMSVYMLLSL